LPKAIEWFKVGKKTPSISPSRDISTAVTVISIIVSSNGGHRRAGVGVARVFIKSISYLVYNSWSSVRTTG
tara:strand:- start:973 stop:1185 length:213 start_codon:yes stop_codon:yes gene_type:complete